MAKPSSPQSCSICQHEDVCTYRSEIENAVYCFEQMCAVFGDDPNDKQVKIAEQADTTVKIAAEHAAGTICPHFKG